MNRLRHAICKTFRCLRNFHFHDVAGLHRETPAGVPVAIRSPGYSVMISEMYLIRKGTENAMSAVRAVLFYFAVETSLDTLTSSGSSPSQSRAHRTKRVEGFAASKLNIFALQIAGSHIVHAGVTKNITEWIVIAAKAYARCLSNHDAKLAFVLDLLRLQAAIQCIARCRSRPTAPSETAAARQAFCFPAPPHAPGSFARRKQSLKAYTGATRLRHSVDCSNELLLVWTMLSEAYEVLNCSLTRKTTSRS